MKRNETRFRMPGKDAIARLQQLLQLGIPGTVKTPVGMLGQLFVTFVASIGGEKESLGIGGMDRNWNAEAAPFMPDWIHPPIVQGNQLARIVPKDQSPSLSK